MSTGRAQGEFARRELGWDADRVDVSTVSYGASHACRDLPNGRTPEEVM